MITKDNYYQTIKSIQLDTLPTALKKAHEFVDKTTSNGSSWDDYLQSQTIQKVINNYFQKLSEYIEQNNIQPEKPLKPHAKVKTNQSVVKPEKVNKSKAQKKPDVTSKTELVERMPEEIRFIKRFINLHGKVKTNEEMLRFINALQKAILEKRIRKTSEYAKQILYIQSHLIKTFENMGKSIKVEINPKTLEEYSVFSKQEKVYPSIQLIKRYISLNGKKGTKQKAEVLAKQIKKAISSSKISTQDKYYSTLKKAWENLLDFIENPAVKTLQIESTELNGLNGILECDCSSLSGISNKGNDFEEEDNDNGDEPRVMNSMDFASLKFDTIGLKGKWFNLIGDPSRNFTAMVFGKPKFGKSYLCFDFAGYLARNHGNALYVAKEEGLDYTLQTKLNDKNVKHPNLSVADDIPDDLSSYDFIFLDSVNKLGLSPKDLETLKRQNPAKSFIFVFQTTKEGNFRGANQYQHDVDVVIEVPEKGKAVQFGRFNQGGEMNIFS